MNTRQVNLVKIIRKAVTETKRNRERNFPSAGLLVLGLVQFGGWPRLELTIPHTGGRVPSSWATFQCFHQIHQQGAELEIDKTKTRLKPNAAQQQPPN